MDWPRGFHVNRFGEEVHLPRSGAGVVTGGITQKQLDERFEAFKTATAAVAADCITLQQLNAELKNRITRDQLDKRFETLKSTVTLQQLNAELENRVTRDQLDERLETFKPTTTADDLHAELENRITRDQLDERLETFKATATEDGLALQAELTRFKSDVESMLNPVKDQVAAVTNSMEIREDSVKMKNKRLVDVAQSVGQHDAVTRLELDNVNKKLKPSITLSELIEPVTATIAGVQHHSLEIQKRKRRITRVNRGIDNHDVVVKEQLDEVSNAFQRFKTLVDAQFRDLERWKKNAGSSVDKLYEKVDTLSAV